jgi:gliding motility-associated-like protein
MNLRITAISFILSVFTVFGQETQQPSWTADYSKSKSFIENLGQFDEHENSSTGKIRYAVDFGSTRIFFGEDGISYSFLEATKIPKTEREALQQKLTSSVSEYKEKERLIGKFLYKSDAVNMKFGNTSNGVKLVGEGETNDYHNYSYEANGEMKSVGFAKGYTKLIYKNIYPNIDIEYTVHPEIGIKYALILHPGADYTKFSMNFDRDLSLLDGRLDIPTIFGSIIDHAPITFYQNDENTIIESKFNQEQRKITFDLGQYDKSKTIVIDPWTQTPAFNTNWDVVWECERDGSGNVYILGGIMPMQVLKYNSSGTLQWTYSTPYDTSNCWLGSFSTDLAGNSYVTRGSVSGMQKIATNGTLSWNNTGGGGSIGNSDEYWTIAFNCDQTGLIVGGTSGALAIPLVLKASIFNINTSNGNNTSTTNVAVGPSSSIPPNVQEVRSIAAAPNGRYYFLTQDTIGFISDNFGLCPNGSSSNLFKTTNGSDLGYKCENYRYDNSSICAMAADLNAVYVNRGNQLQKRSLIDLSIQGTVAIPGGSYSSVFLGGNVLANSGIAVDDCGNIYVGSTTGVYKFNSSLVQQGFYATTFKVYDVAVNSAGEIVACGGTGTSADGTRSGGVATFAASACIPIASTCCDATICDIPDMCVSASPVTLNTATAGGTWSGTGVNASGQFNPATAGPGTHIITYSLTCGSSQSISITVNSCSSLNVCEESNGTFTVSGGTGPYTWQEWEPAQTVTITTQAECISCGYSWSFGTCLNGFFPATSCTLAAGWSTFATGTNVTPPVGATSIQILDNSGGSVIIDPNTVVPCGINPCPTINVTTSALTNVSCFGQTNGSATVSASGGTGAYTYTWTPGNLNGATQSTLGAGTYTVNVLDANNCPGSTTITITQPTSALSVAMSSTATNCGSNTGTATATPTGGTTSYSYAWTPSGNTGTINGLAAGTYSVVVTDGNGCQANGSTTVSTNGGPSISVTSSSDVNCNGGNDGAATVSGSGGTGTLSYSWSPGALSGATQSTLTAGSYTVTVTDGGGCTNSTTVTINEPSAINVVSSNITPANCGVSDGSASVTVSGGAGGFTYAWSPTGGSTATASNIAAGAYTIDVEDQNGCTESLTIVVPNIGGPTVTVSASTDASCFGENDGSATVSVTGGTSPYTYNWVPTGGTNPNATNLTAGTYTVAVTDNTGCVGSTTVTIGEPTQITIDETLTNVNCGSSDGQISTTVNGGSGSYTYLWTPNGETTSSLNGLTPGSYGVTVTDINGCTATGTYVLTTIGTLPITVSPTSTTIQAGESVQLNASGGTTYTWTPSTGLSCDTCATTIASPSITTIYTVTGTDASGCIGTVEALVLVQQVCGDIYVPTVFAPNGTGNAENKMVCIYGNCIVELKYAIYNRWGEKVFETEDSTICWDGTYKGKDMNAGVFAYKLMVTLSNGEYIEESGNITLVR